MATLTEQIEALRKKLTVKEVGGQIVSIKPGETTAQIQDKTTLAPKEISKLEVGIPDSSPSADISPKTL